MNKKTIGLIALSLLVTLGACAKKSTPTPSVDIPSSTPPTPKALTSVWTVSNSAWSIDWSGVNLSGTPFTMTLTMSDHVRSCTCGITLNGTDSAGTCSVTTACAFANAGGSDPGCASGFGMCAGGGYTNDGTNLHFTSGATYH